MSERRESHPARVAGLIIAGFVAFMLFMAGCGDDDDDDGGGDTGDLPTKIGQTEGALNLVAWAGYVEDGSTDPSVDWTTDFEQQTGCQVNVKIGNTSDEMVQLMRTGQYDGVSASGDASTRLIEGGDVVPVNTDLVPNYKDIFPGLKEQEYNSVDGQMYGIPHGRGSNLVMYRTDLVKPPPKDSWSVVFDPQEAAEYKGKVTAYDSPIYIADAAVYLKEHRPDLGITDPYELDQEQFDAAIELLKQQNEFIGEYWSDYTKEIQSFASGDLVVGTAWPYQWLTLIADDQPVDVVYPSKEGATGWSDTWMLSSEAKHPNCMYLWFNHITSPDAQAQVAEWFGEAPANQKACDITATENFCETVGATGPNAYLDDLYYWKTPISDCGDDRGEVCKDYNEWIQGWTEVKG